MVFIIPTVTLFQELTPQRLMGRVVSSRQALVFGSIAASMALSGYLAGVIGPASRARHRRRHLRGGRRDRHPDPPDAKRPLNGRSATLRAPWD